MSNKKEREAITVASFLLLYAVVLVVLLVGRQWLAAPLESTSSLSEPITNAATVTPASP